MKSNKILKTSKKQPNPGEIPIGVVGLGLMSRSIITCLLSAGHPVVAVSRSRSKCKTAKRHVLTFLKELKHEGLLKAEPSKVIQRFSASTDYFTLGQSKIVIESIAENLEAKRGVIQDIEVVVSPETLICSNTSAIPITSLQQGAQHPERVLGMHWAEPAHLTRFMEITCGKDTDPKHGQYLKTLARMWGKEPSLLSRDIRGFITNRIFYAMLREAFNLVESGVATIEDVDRSMRNDLGYWITFAGPFRFMDLTGIPAYEAVTRDLFPELSCNKEVPALMKKVVDSGAQGVSNAKGFYSYTPAEAKRWEKLFMKFTYEIRALARKYPEDIGKKPLKEKHS
jgi:3-hydroxybutyryl-CoA dehydrogenase